MTHDVEPFSWTAEASSVRDYSRGTAVVLRRDLMNVDLLTPNEAECLASLLTLAAKVARAREQLEHTG